MKTKDQTQSCLTFLFIKFIMLFIFCPETAVSVKQLINVPVLDLDFVLVSFLDFVCVCVCVCAVSYTHLDVYKRQW